MNFPFVYSKYNLTNVRKSCTDLYKDKKEKKSSKRKNISKQMKDNLGIYVTEVS